MPLLYGADPGSPFRLRGIHYVEALAALHEELAPSTYLEIGTFQGRSLKLASCASVAVDPEFKLDGDCMGEKPALHLLRGTSAEIFRSGRLEVLFPKGPDLIFLDGLHLVEAIFDDFVCSERIARPETTILIHDPLPMDEEMASREQRGPRTDPDTANWWTGDVWKMVPILREYRPDLRLTVLDCPPTGLLVVQEPDPANDTLQKRRDEILGQWLNIDLGKYEIGQLYNVAYITQVPDRHALMSAVCR